MRKRSAQSQFCALGVAGLLGILMVSGVAAAGQAGLPTPPAGSAAAAAADDAAVTTLAAADAAAPPAAAPAAPAAPAPIVLPPPHTTGGMPLREALAARHSTREFGPAALPPQALGDLLWAAFGVNRPDSGRRTAPSAKNWQEIDVYVATEAGVYLYDAPAHALRPVLAGDRRADTGGQPFVATAPVNLVYVADDARTGQSTPEERALYSAADAAFIAQNVYLFCAAEGLGCVVRGWVDREALAAAWGLRPQQRVILAQTVGYPK